MRRGRRPTGARLVEKLDGPADAKQRLAWIIETLAGRHTVATASQMLGLSERRFYALREQLLVQALHWLQPRPPGRPRLELTANDVRIKQMEEEVQRLQFELKAAQVREEIAIALPRLARRMRPAKKTARRGQKRRSATP